MSLALCIAAAGTLLLRLPVTNFSLAWTHSIERVRWEEDWRVGADGLRVVAARVRGSAAGMEPPPDARLRDGVWHYAPRLAAQPVLRLARSTHTADWTLCVGARCAPLADWLGDADNPVSVELSACAAREPAAP